MSDSLPRRPLAAVDLGSNSFRLLLAEIDQSSAGPQLRILDQIKEAVRLGAGLDREFQLSEEARQRALQALGRFAERLEGLELEAFRAVATNTFRVAHNIGAFLKEASAVLGRPIEVVAGREEARLIYLGAAHSLPRDHQLRLVVDIGGGSTECIIGVDEQPRRRESLQIGCVALTQQFFSSGKITKAAMRKARLHCGEQLAAHVHGFKRLAVRRGHVGHGQGAAGAGQRQFRPYGHHPRRALAAGGPVRGSRPCGCAGRSAGAAR